MADCDPQDLLNDAACFACLSPGDKATVELQLLYEIAGTEETVAELLDKAQCFACLSEQDKSTLKLQLLCEILNAGT
jgi:hypothetical protein